MSDLSSWEQKNIEILTSKEMGEWLERREKRMPVVPVSVLEGIKAEIDKALSEETISDNRQQISDVGVGLELALNFIDKHIKEYTA